MGSDQSINDGKSLQSVNNGSNLSFLIVKKIHTKERKSSQPPLNSLTDSQVLHHSGQIGTAIITYFLDSNYGSMVHLTTEHIFNM